MTGDDLHAALAAVAEGVTDALSRGHAAVVRAAEKREAILHEQVGVLRWLLSGYSSAAQAPWADLPPAQAAVAAAIELDRLTRFRVGVPDAEPLLAQTVALADAAPADPDADRGLAGQLPDPGPLADLAPLLAAAREGTAAPSSASPADLAFGLYSELRLVRAYRAAW